MRGLRADLGFLLLGVDVEQGFGFGEFEGRFELITAGQEGFTGIVLLMGSLN